jgi:ribonuclease Z
MVRAHLSPLKLDAIFITHLHGDHFLGLAGLVQTMSLMDRAKPLEVYCPAGERDRLETYIRTPRYTLTFDVAINELEPGAKLQRKGYQILTSEVEHSVPELAYALVEGERPGKLNVKRAIELGVRPGPAFSRLKAGESVELADGRVVRPEEVVGPKRPGRKVVYAGDTKPSERLVEFARGADVLIHDSTLADELLEKANQNFHSTPSGAAEIARRAEVKQLVLIHVSPRYENDFLLLKQARKIFPNTVVAHDLMELEIPLQK